uniref:plasmid replication protein n=1 Tax=Klebsiella pneumoniae TaxID=573 RepID=UPI0013C305CA
MIINGKKIKAKEIMEMTGRSERTLRNYSSQSLDDYEKTAIDRRRQAYELRSQGLKWQQVADKMGCSYHGAVALYRRYVALD